jgi:hypothetical protein
MGKLIVYNNATGEIVRNVVCPDELESLQAGVGETMIPGNNFEPTLYYVSGGIVSDRPIPANVECSHETIQANGVDEAVLTGVPNPSTVTVLDANGEGGNYEVTDGQLEMTFADPGIYTITVMPAFPNQFVVLTLEAV